MHFYFGLQVNLFKDRQGLKFAIKFRCFKVNLEKAWVLKQSPQWCEGNPVPQGNPDLTPTIECPEMLVEVLGGKLIEPEDM